MSYSILLFVKLVSVAVYAGGVVAAFVASAPAERKRAVHAIASPSLVVMWIAGYLLSSLLYVPISEAWIALALPLSLVSQLALVRSVSRPRNLAGFLATTVPWLAAVALMVFRPTWSSFR
jgi:hypothetical protein